MVGRVGVRSEPGKTITGWRATLGIPMGVLRVATAPHTRAGIRHPQDSVSVRLLAGAERLGDLAHSTIRYGAQWVPQDHADLNTLRASRPHQENTLSYSRRQETGLAVVEQYSIKQTSVLFQSQVHRGLGNTQWQPPHSQAAGIPQDSQDSSNFSLSLFPPLSCPFSFLVSYRPSWSQGGWDRRGHDGTSKTVSDAIPSQLCQ